MSSLSCLSVVPAAIVPPYTISAGRLTRAMPMMTPGMFLSQPGIVIPAS